MTSIPSKFQLHVHYNDAVGDNFIDQPVTKFALTLKSQPFDLQPIPNNKGPNAGKCAPRFLGYAVLSDSER